MAVLHEHLISTSGNMFPKAMVDVVEQAKREESNFENK